MTPESIKTIMLNQNLSVKDLATISDVTTRQVIAWRMGTSPVPQILSFLLTALETGQITQDWLVEVLQEELRNKII